MTASTVGLSEAILSSIFSSISVIFQVRALQSLHPLIISSLALLLGSFLFLIYFYFSAQLPNFSALKKDLRALVALVTLRCLAGNILFVYSLSMTTGIKAMFFTKAEPYFVLLWLWLIKKQVINRKHVALLALHIAAALMLSTGGKFELGKGQLGDILILLAMACSSLSYFYGMNVSKSLGARATNSVTQMIGGLVIFPFALALVPQNGWSISHPGWFYLCAHVMLFNVVALTLWFQAIKSVDAWIVSALRAIGPVVAAPLAWIFLGEELNLLQIISAGVVLLTSALIAKEHIASAKVKSV